MGAVVLGIYLRRVLPEHYLSADTKDAVKLAMGLVATMSALVLGLLVTSVKGAYDTRRGEVRLGSEEGRQRQTEACLGAAQLRIKRAIATLTRSGSI
jgi:hypothetical protein